MAKQKNHNGILYTRVTPWYRWDKLYHLDRIYWLDVGLKPSTRIDVGRYINLMPNGVLYIQDGFLFGPSGPTIDTEGIMRGSLVHDALYAMLRSGKLIGRLAREDGILDHDDLRMTADKWMRHLCYQDGTPEIRCNWIYDALRVGGASSAELNGPRKETTLKTKLNQPL